MTSRILQPITMNLEHNISTRISKIRITKKHKSQDAIASAERLREKTREKLRKKKDRIRTFRVKTLTRVEKSKVNNENDKIRKIEMRENDARKSLIRFATHRPTISKDQNSIAKRVDALRRLHVSKKYSELERQRARVSSQRRDTHSRCEKERYRKLQLFRERMEKHQREHRVRAEAERLRELERLSELKKCDRESASTRQRRKKEIQLRFVDALRIRLSEHMKRSGYGVVPLCGCSTLSEDGVIPNWTECANNCEFHNNPEKFHDAVKSMFSSIHEVERFRRK